MLLPSLLPLTKSRAAVVQSLWPGSSSLLQSKWIVKAESSLVSMEKDGKLCIFAQHMFRDSFFLSLSGFFLPSMTSSRLLLCLKPPFGYILTLLPSKRCFDLPQQSASKADKGRGLPFHVLARLLVKSSRETLCNLSMQFKKPHYSKLPTEGLFSGAEVLQEPVLWGCSPLTSEEDIAKASPTNVAVYKISLLILGKLFKIKQLLPVWWSSTPFNLPQKYQFSYLTIFIRRND